MLCDLCKKNPATFHYTKIVNGEVEEIHLCSECSTDQDEVNPSLSIHNFLTGLIDSLQGDNIKKDFEQIYCEKCKLSYSQFKKIGKLGCDRCYTDFNQKLEPLIRGIQGSTVHKGKIPSRADKALKLERKIGDLKNRLKNHVAKEEFEEAAVLRDEIRALEKTLEEGD